MWTVWRNFQLTVKSHDDVASPPKDLKLQRCVLDGREARPKERRRVVYRRAAGTNRLDEPQHIDNPALHGRKAMTNLKFHCSGWCNQTLNTESSTPIPTS